MDKSSRHLQVYAVLQFICLCAHNTSQQADAIISISFNHKAVIYN